MSRSLDLKRTGLAADSLAFSLLYAARATEAVLKGTALPAALGAICRDEAITAQAAGAIQDIAYRSMRLLGTSRFLLGRMTKKQPEPAFLQALLMVSLSLLIEDSPGSPLPYSAHTAVNQAVTAVSAVRPIAHARALTNALLRRFIREKETLMREVADKPEARWNYPGWWIHACQQAYPQQWADILNEGNQHPPLTLRVNQRKIGIEKYLALLDAHNLRARPAGPLAVILETPLPVQSIPGFADGLVSVQDAAAQLAAPLLEIEDGMRVLDACAAPGGKTGHILESADVDLLALDEDEKRLRLIHENLDRLQLRATVMQGDASSNAWWDGQPFDRILADVPCTASGIVRRHPDIRWLRRESDSNQLATLSGRILDNLWQMLRPGGKLLFVTCSIWPLESEEQASTFAKKPDAIRLPAPGQLLPCSGHDGLFYALFEKTAD